MDEISIYTSQSVLLLQTVKWVSELRQLWRFSYSQS